MNSSRNGGARRTLRPSGARNQIQARVISINNGEAIANVELDAGGTRLVASITVEAVQALVLSEGSKSLP